MQKMLHDSLYLEEVKELILANNKLSITEVRNLTFLKGLNFDKEKYSSIAELIKQKRIDEIKQLPDIKPKTFEDLSIFQFNDQNDNLYVVTVYDSDELWQDPQIIEIYPL
jgi:hypothetical protein